MVLYFKYLGLLITSMDGSSKEIEVTVAAGNSCNSAIIGVLRSKVVSSYACKMLTITTIGELNTWERQILRKLFDEKQADVIYERRIDQELRVCILPTLSLKKH